MLNSRRYLRRAARATLNLWVVRTRITIWAMSIWWTLQNNCITTDSNLIRKVAPRRPENKKLGNKTRRHYSKVYLKAKQLNQLCSTLGVAMGTVRAINMKLSVSHHEQKSPATIVLERKESDLSQAMYITSSPRVKVVRLGSTHSSHTRTFFHINISSISNSRWLMRKATYSRIHKWCKIPNRLLLSLTQPEQEAHPCPLAISIKASVSWLLSVKTLSNSLLRASQTNLCSNNRS